MFADADLDINKRAKNDQVIQNMLHLARENFWEENFDLLAAIFNERSMQKGDHLELSKNDLKVLLKDAKILII